MKIIKKILVYILISSFLLGNFANCFGKFALVRKLHEFNSGINVGGPWVAKVIRTLIMYLSFFFAGWWMFAIDIVILNLIEFWTDKNLLGYNEYDPNGNFVKTFSEDGHVIELRYSNFGSRLDVSMVSGGDKNFFTVLRSEPGKIYNEVSGQLVEVNVEEVKFQSAILLKTTKGGKLESSKVIDVKEYKELENKLSEYSL
jgi:hypothetical protein